MLSQEVKKTILNLQQKYPEKRSALIPALHLAQSEIGCLPLEIQKEIAVLFDIDPEEVHSIVTFYDMFYEKPVGKHIVHVCKNVSCMLRGGDDLLSRVCQKLGVSPGQTTADQEFTVIGSECLAACDRAPMMLVDDQVIGPVSLENVDVILESAQKEKGHICPVIHPEVSYG